MERWTQPAGRSRLYAILAVVVGLVLVAAGLLKAYHLQTGGAGISTWAGDVGREVVVAEVLFGVWLLAGFYPVWTRWITLLVFLGLFNVSVVQYLTGRASCGCLGNVSVAPLTMAVFDALVLVAVAWSRPHPAAPASAPARNGRLATLAVVALVGAAWVVPARVDAVSADERDRAAAADDLAVFHDVVLPRLAENEAAIKTLVVETRETSTSFLKKDQPEIDALGRRFVCDGQQVRRDTFLEAAGKRELRCVDILVGNRFVQYDPDTRFANIRETDDRELGLCIDFRTIALRPPVGGLAAWLGAAQVVSVKVEGKAPARTVRAVFEVPSRDRRPPALTAELVLEEAAAFLPTQATYRSRRSGDVRSKADVRYAQAGPNGPFVAVRGEFEFFDLDGGYSGKAQFELARPPVVNQPVADSEFDMPLPPGTRLGGNLSTGPNVSKAGSTLSKVSLPTAPPREAPSRLGVLAARPGTVLGLNLALLSACAGVRLFLGRRGAGSGPAAADPVPHS